MKNGQMNIWKALPFLILGLVLYYVLVGCAPQEPLPTLEPLPSQTAYPTSTPRPTYTPQPTLGLPTIHILVDEKCYLDIDTYHDGLEPDYPLDRGVYEYVYDTHLAGYAYELILETIGTEWVTCWVFYPPEYAPTRTPEVFSCWDLEDHVANSWHGYWQIVIPGEEVYTGVIFEGKCMYVWAQFYNVYGWKYTLEGFVDPSNPNFLWCTLTREKPKIVISEWDCVLKFKSAAQQERWQGSFQKKSSKTFAICGGVNEEMLPIVCKYTP